MTVLKLKRETHWLDFYPGGIPAGIQFDTQVIDACQIADIQPAHKNDKRTGIGAEFALIGLIAYFEGFCKNHTAAVINICPDLVRGLAAGGRDIKLRPIDILDFADHLGTQFGSLVVDKIDFGTAKAINALYYDLIGLTPFSKREAERFHELLEDRHLIVHHGNVFTPRFAGQRFIRREIGRSRIFVDSLVVTTDDVRAAAKFLHGLSVKIRDGSRQGLDAFIKRSQIQLPKHNREAAKYLDTVLPDNG